MTEYIIVIMAAILTNNFVLVQFLGICPFLGVSKKLDSAFGMSCAVIFVMLIATAATWPIQTYILDPKGLGYLQTIVFILVIAALVQLVEMILKKFIKPLYEALGVYLPLITTNCAVLGLAISNIDNGYNFAESLACSFGKSFGFLISIVILAGLREKPEHNNIPKPFQGTAIVLITACLMSIAFMGFSGMI